MPALNVKTPPPTAYTTDHTDTEIGRARVAKFAGGVVVLARPRLVRFCAKGNGTFTIALRKVPTDSGPTAPTTILTVEANGEYEVELNDLGPQSGFSSGGSSTWPGVTGGAPDKLCWSLTLGSASSVLVETACGDA